MAAKEKVVAVEKARVPAKIAVATRMVPWTNFANVLLGLLLVLSSLGPVLGVSWGGSAIQQLSDDFGGQLVSTDRCFRSGASVCDELAFDSTRGYPGEGPGEPTPSWDVDGRNGTSVDGIGDSGKFRPPSRCASTNPPHQRPEVGGGCAFARGPVRNTRSGVPIHLPPETVAPSETVAFGGGVNGSCRDGDRSSAYCLQSDREMRGARRGQMFTLVGEILRTKTVTSGPMADGTDSSATDIRNGGSKLITTRSRNFYIEGGKQGTYLSETSRAACSR